MAKRNCDIYGPDLSGHEGQAKEIAAEGLKIMRDVGATGKEAKSDGPDVSRNNLEKLK